MLLSDIVGDMREVELAGSGDPGIAAIVLDSREAGPGALFAALPGSKGDGMDFIEDAVRLGAAALLLPRLPEPAPVLPCVVANDVRKALGEAAASFYDHPSRSLDLIGVTGTNGKTTTAYIVRHIFNEAARRCGMLGTVEYDLGDRIEPAPLTTPDAVRFSRGLAEMRDFGCRAAVVEASSHALAQRRVWPHRFAAAIFTNLTRDHLDYHGDMDAYLEAKRSLFANLDDRAVAVVNDRDPAAARIMEGCRARILAYRLAGDNDGATAPAENRLRVTVVRSGLDGQTFTIEGDAFSGEFRTRLVGRHNIENCAGAVLAAAGLGITGDTIARALASFAGVPGRLERIESRDGRVAFVDFAHTDDALRSVLSVLRPLVKGRLITVFGCGGDRDRGKRPLMAKAAEAFSDLVVVTSDNPRGENPDDIIGDIMPGFAKPDKVRVDADRESAVRLAASLAQSGDVILVAGKGHENYQIVGTERRHLDDRELVCAAFGRADGRPAQERNRQ